MNLLGLRYFIAVADCASFTKATEHLFVTQPTLSRQIMDLENEMGTPLFIRNRHSLTLTDAGNRFLKQAVSIVDQVDRLKEIVNPGDGAQTGHLRIGYQSFLDTSLMSQCLKIITEKYPHVEMPLFCGTPSELRQQLVTEKCDVLFALTPCIEGLPNVETINIQPDQLKIAVSKTHRLAQQDSVNLKDLADENFIMLDRKVSPFSVDYAISLCMKNGFSPNASYYADDAEKALMLAGAGKGITFIHTLNKVSRPIKSFDVKLLNIDGQNAEFNFVLAYKKDNKNPMLTTFITEVTRYLAQEKA